MDTVEVYLGIGSNEGDRHANIEEALTLLEKSGVLISGLSDIIETAPWGFEAPQKFLNCAVRCHVNADVRPESLLKICKDIEHELGRHEKMEFDADGKRVYHSRPIDIDILFYGDEVVDTEELIIPHTGMESRNFVMIPLRQVASGYIKSVFPELFKK